MTWPVNTPMTSRCLAVVDPEESQSIGGFRKGSSKTPESMTDVLKSYLFQAARIPGCSKNSMIKILSAWTFSRGVCMYLSTKRVRTLSTNTNWLLAVRGDWYGLLRTGWTRPRVRPEPKRVQIGQLIRASCHWAASRGYMVDKGYSIHQPINWRLDNSTPWLRRHQITVHDFALSDYDWVIDTILSINKQRNRRNSRLITSSGYCK